MKKQITNILFGLFIVFFLVYGAKAQNVSVWDGSSAIWTQGSGTEADPYLIESAQNLAWISEMVNSGVTTYSGVWFKLTTDLNMNNLAWVPVGNSETNCFCGKFDGYNHFIDNISITSGYTYKGLFGYTNNATIANISANVNISSCNYSAGIIGYANATAITNCHIRSGTVNGSKYVGGIVAYCNGNSPIESCSNAANIMVSGDVYAAGGICGVNYSSKTNCHNMGSVSVTKTSCSQNNYTAYAGGICGMGGGVFTNCSNRGSISATNNRQYVNNEYHNYTYTHSYYSTAIAGGITCSGACYFCYNLGDVSSVSYDNKTNYTTVDETPTYWYTYNYYYYYQCKSGGISPSGTCRYCYNRGVISTSKTKTADAYGVGYICYNSYNTGNITVSNAAISSKYGVGDNVTNSHYLQGCGATAGGTSKTEIAMKSASFPVILNADSTVFVMDITPNINNGYPIFGSSHVYSVTQEPTNITFNAATIQGVYHTDYVDVVGFEYKPITANNYITVYTNIGSPVSYNLIGLQSGTTYQYRMFVQKDGITYYGNEVSFTTLSCDLQASIARSVTEMCDGDSAIFTASCSSAHSNLFTYQWNTSETGNMLHVSDAATHTVTVQDTNGCSATASAAVEILPLPQGIISGNTLLCPGESSILTASGANRYNWSTGATSPTLTVNTSGIYTCTFTNSYNCSMTQSVEVNVFESPVILGELNICEGGSTTLTALGGNAYVWSNGAQTPSITVNNADTYIVTATSGNCSATASVTTSVISLPQVSISGNTVICSGIGTTLTANEGTTYLWSNGASTQSIIANNPGTYAVTVSNAAGCTNSASVNVTLMDNVTISGVPYICQGESTTLSVSNEGNYIWSNGANTSFISVSQPGNYSVTVTLPNGCSSSATINVTEASNPTPAISGNTSICEGQSTTLTANGGNSYLWSNGSTSNNISVSQSGTYTVTATNVEGCSAIAQVNVTVNPLPNVYISGNSGFCQGGDVQLTANGANSYLWSNGSTNANITVSNAGTYSVTGTDANGCTNPATKSISVNPTYTIPRTHSIC